MPPAWLAGAAGVALTCAYFLLPTGGREQAVLYSGIGLAAAVALALGARSYLQGRLRLPWYLLAAGAACFAAGDALFGYYELSGETPFPSAADAAYLGGYPLLFAGVALLVARLRGPELRFALADAFVVAGAVALVQWVFVMEPLAAEESGVARAILLAYPAMDILLVAALARLLFTPAWKLPAFRLLSAAVLLQLVGDEVFLTLADSYHSGSWLDSAWLVSYVLLGAAGLHPSVWALARTTASGDPRLGWARVLLLGAALVSVPVALASGDAAGTELAIVAGSAAALSILVLLRIVDLVRALTAQNDRLRELDRLKDEFIGLVSHDLRTPLTSISGYVELLLDDEEGTLAETQRGFLGVVERNTHRLQKLVDDLLFEARIQAGWDHLDLAEVDVGELARRCVEDNRPSAQESGTKISLDADHPAVVVGDSSRLGQLLDNLVSNALKFTPPGGRVAVTVADGPNGIVLEVADEGIGIAEPDQERLFERFYRAPTARMRQIPGTGLGLHIVRAIVDAHQGAISVRSREGAGATFRVELPLSPPASLRRGAAGTGSRTL